MAQPSNVTASMLSSVPPEIVLFGQQPGVA
jgi:hypothetical protein